MYFTPHAMERLVSRFKIKPSRISNICTELTDRIQRKHFIITDKHADAYHVVTWFGDGRGILLVLSKNLATVITCYEYSMDLNERIFIKEHPGIEFRKG